MGKTTVNDEDMKEKGNTLVGEYVMLRAPEPEDVDVMCYFENLADGVTSPVATGPYSRYQLKKYILESENDLFADRQLRLMILNKNEGRVIGIIDLFDFSPRFRRAELGIILNKVYRRRGLAREALGLLEAHCVRLGIHQLYVYVQSDNTASLNFFVSAGYQVSGTLRDWLLEGERFQDVLLLQKVFS